MRKNLLSKVMLLLMMLLVGISSWAQSDYSKIYTSNVTLTGTGGTNASTCTVVIGETNISGVKAGTSKAAGAWKVNVPSGTKYLHLHAAGWNGESVTLTVTPSGYSDKITLTANSGISGNAPYTFSGDASSTNYYKVITFTNALTSDTDLTFTASSGKRFVVFGVNSEELSTDTRTAVNITDFSATSTTLVKGNTTSTSVCNDQSGWTAAYIYSSDDESVATVDGDGVITAVAKGTANITATLNVDSEDASYKAGTTTSMSIAITVTNPTHTATFSINGNTDNTAEVEEGEDITFPTEVADIAGKKFVGWYGSAYSNASTAPTYVTSAKMGTQDITYYAVFADIASAGTATTEELTTSEITSLSSSSALAYATETTYTDGSINYSMYAYTDNKSRPWLQLKADQNVYIGVTAPENITQVELSITSATNSSGGITDISKHSAFSGRVGIVTQDNEKFTTTTENIGYAENVSDNKATIVPTEDAKTIYIKVSSGARIWGVSITYGTPATYANYATSVETTTTVTLASACTDGDMYYGTYSSSKAFVASSDVVVSEVGIDANGKLNVQSYTTGDVVPANTGVMISSDSYDTPLTLTYSNESGTSVLGDDNCLRPTGDSGIDATAMAAVDASCKFYRLSVHEGDAGFYYGAAMGAAFDVVANKAYLAVPTTLAGEVKGFNLSDLMDAIKSVTTEKQQTSEAYNLMGQRVQRTQKGIVIVNGKKYFNK